MDKYKQLKLEFPGIRNTILNYTRNANIRNYLDGLGKALDEDKYDEVLYFVGKTVEWYRTNMGKILSNQFASNKDDHMRNAEALQEIYKSLQADDFDHLQAQGNEMAEEKAEAERPTKIFLSHCSANKKIGDALEKLITGLGVRNQQLIYTSHPLHKIPLDENIYDYLRNNINENVFVMFLLSDEYFESSPCLNEMGAAWVIRSDYSIMYTPGFDFHNDKYLSCAIDTDKMGVLLSGDDHCKAGINELIDKILGLFGLKIDFSARTFLLDRFVADIR